MEKVTVIVEKSQQSNNQSADEKVVTITCSECETPIKMTANDAFIQRRLNGGCPCLDITVDCPTCKKKSKVRKTADTASLLEERIKNRDYNYAGYSIIRETK